MNVQLNEEKVDVDGVKLDVSEVNVELHAENVDVDGVNVDVLFVYVDASAGQKAAERRRPTGRGAARNRSPYALICWRASSAFWTSS